MSHYYKTQIKAILAVIILISLLLLFSKPVLSQNYDTTNFIKVTLIKIEPSMKSGWRLTVKSEKDTVYIPMLRVNRETREQINQCVLMGKEQWETLLVNNKKL